MRNSHYKVLMLLVLSQKHYFCCTQNNLCESSFPAVNSVTWVSHELMEFINDDSLKKGCDIHCSGFPSRCGLREWVLMRRLLKALQSRRNERNRWDLAALNYFKTRLSASLNTSLQERGKEHIVVLFEICNCPRLKTGTKTHTKRTWQFSAGKAVMQSAASEKPASILVMVGASVEQPCQRSVGKSTWFSASGTPAVLVQVVLFHKYLKSSTKYVSIYHCHFRWNCPVWFFFLASCFQNFSMRDLYHIDYFRDVYLCLWYCQVQWC